MKAFCCFALFCCVVWPTSAAILEFDLSPEGHGTLPGLSPLNEVIPGTSSGSGGEIGTGILFDTTTRQLTLSIGYGTMAGFNDLTGPAFSWLLHAPAPFGETSPAILDLAPLHVFAEDHSRGGILAGSLTLTLPQAAALQAGMGYINIYTPANLGGEIRGQLVVVPEPSTGFIFMLSIVAVIGGRRTLKRLRRR